MTYTRRFIRALVLVVVLAAGAGAIAAALTQTVWFKDWLRGYIEREANQYLNGRVSIQRLGGNLFFGVELENIAVSLDGKPVVAVKDLGLDYNAFELISKGLSVAHLRLNQPVLYLQHEGDAWNVSRLVKKQETEADRSGPDRPITIADIGISDGSVVIEGSTGVSGVEIPKRIDRLDAKLSFKYEPVRYSIEITHVSFRGSDPEIALNALSGGVAVRDDTVYIDRMSVRTAETALSIDGAVQQYLTTPNVKLQIGSEKTSLPEIARVVPALSGIDLQPAFELKLDGPLDHLAVDVNARSSAGQVTGTVVTDLMAPDQSVTGDISVRHLNLEPILNSRRQKSDITADAKIDLHAAAFSNPDSLRGTLTVQAPRIVAAGYAAERIQATAKVDGRRVAIDGRAAAYAATITAVGRVTLPEKTDAGPGAVKYDVHGQVRHVDLRRMPRDLGIPRAATNISAGYHVVGAGPRVRGDARFEPSTVAGAQVAAGSTVGFSIEGKNISYEADATVTNLDLQQAGQQFQVKALETDQYKSSLDAHVSASGHGTRPKDIDLTATGTLTNSSILGARIPQLAFNARFADDNLHIQADGSFVDVDPSIASGRPAMKGQLAGSLNVDATIEGVSQGVTVDTVQASAKVNLEPSSIGGLEITRGTLDGDYRQSMGDIRALEIVGRDLNVTASGRVALNDTGQSNLTVHADSSNLDEVGKLIDRPLTGIAKVDATVTGNKQELQAVGKLTGNDLRYADNGALTMSSDFTARVPQLTLAGATVSATTDATFVSIGGQNINSLTAKTDYGNSQLVFNMTARQTDRSLAATGCLVLYPDQQEVQLDQLELQAQNMKWQTRPGARPVIQYGDNAVTVKDLTLVNGTQEISATGRFGRPGDALTVTLANIDLSTVDALMLRPPRFFGTLNASGEITGTKDAPLVKADFAIKQGAFQQYKYDTFDGTVSYRDNGVTLDTKLQQNPTAWITVKGYVPKTVLAGPARPGAGHVEAAAAEDRIDVHVDSSPLDLAVVQGFTTAVSKVQGTFEAHLQVTGSAEDPHPVGAVTVQNGAFTVDQTGVAYTNLRGQVDFQPDRVHISEITILDNQQSALSITGDLATHEGQIGGVHLYVNASDFKVIDNKMGKVRIDTNLEIAGELRSPRVEGDLDVSTGTVDLDPILATLGDSPYPTKSVDDVSDQPDGAAPSPLDRLRLNVGVSVPNDLVIKAADFTTPGAPIGLGAMNLTVGGDLRATKEPGGKPQLVGSINIVRGFYEFQGRRFDILRDSSLRFDGVDPLQPTLDIRAQRVIQAVTANVNVRGTLDKPEIVLTSTPPLEQADILSLIVFNQPINELGEGQQVSLAQRAQALATGAIAGELSKSIEHTLKLSEFEINTAPESGGAAQVTLGQQVGQNLYVKLQQGIGDQSQTNFIIEYELAKWLRLQTNVLQGSSTQQQLFQRMQGSGVNALFFFSY